MSSFSDTVAGDLWQSRAVPILRGRIGTERFDAFLRLAKLQAWEKGVVTLSFSNRHAVIIAKRHFGDDILSVLKSLTNGRPLELKLTSRDCSFSATVKDVPAATEDHTSPTAVVNPGVQQARPATRQAITPHGDALAILAMMATVMSVPSND